MVVADRTNSESESVTETDAMDDSMRFRLHSNEKTAIARAARAHDRKPGNFVRVIVREWLRQNGYLSIER